MSLPKKSFFRFSLILPLVILLILVFTVQKQGMSAMQEGPGEKAKIARYEKNFNGHLGELFADLTAHFKDRGYEEMADLLVDRTVLYTPSGERITTKGEFLTFFKQAHRPEVIDLKFRVVCSKVFLVAEINEEEEDPIDAIGHAIFTYHLITKRGETITNQDGSGEYGARHPSSCVWGGPPGG